METMGRLRLPSELLVGVVCVQKARVCFPPTLTTSRILSTLVCGSSTCEQIPLYLFPVYRNSDINHKLQDTAMAKTKYILHACAYCHKQTKMELVGEMQMEGQAGDQQKVWYRCTRCKHSALISKNETERPKNGGSVKIDHSSFLEYSKEKVFSVGQIIYHTEWDDYGKVLAKQRTSNGIHAITVAFEKSGERRLVENVAPEESTETEQHKQPVDLQGR